MLLRGDLAFHTPGDPNSSTATHARWTGSGGSALEGLVVVIQYVQSCGQRPLIPRHLLLGRGGRGGIAPDYEHRTVLLTLFDSRSGDMTRRSEECGLFHQFALAKAAAVPTAEDAFELALDEPVSLEVGEGGIIGRRVSIFSSSSFQRPPSTGEAAVAEGIVGFNFMQPVAASL
jgi:hypothetical protein